MTDTAAPGSPEDLVKLFPGARAVLVLEPLDLTNPLADRQQAEVIVRPLNLLESAALLVELKPLFAAWGPDVPALKLVSEQMPTVLKLAEAATSRAADWIGHLDAGDAIAVGVAVIEANENLSRQVVDLVAGPTGARLTKMFATITGGPTPSPSSPDTASPPRVPLRLQRARSTA